MAVDLEADELFRSRGRDDSRIGVNVALGVVFALAGGDNTFWLECNAA